MVEQTEGSIHIAATPKEVMDVITDFDTYPTWTSGIKRVEVRMKDSQGRPAEVAFEVSQMGIGAEYTLAYRYRPNHAGLSWTTTSASGAVKDIQGEYTLEPSGKGTKVTYRIGIEPAIPVVGFIKRQAEKTIISTALGGLKKRVEGR